jgi:hypothetical protein
MKTGSLLTTATFLLLWCQIQHFHLSPLGIPGISSSGFAAAEGCDFTCNNKTVDYQFVRCDMCVCRKICGIHQNKDVYNGFYQVRQ